MPKSSTFTTAQLSGLSDLVAEREQHARADVRHQLRGGDAVAAGNFKDDGDRGNGLRRQAWIGNGSGDDERDGD